MPTLIRQKCFSQVYTTASTFPSQVLSYLEADPQNANIILSHLLKTAASEEKGVFENNLWVVSWSYPDSCSDPNLDFVLSCTQGPAGAYPVFVYHARPLLELTDTYLEPRIAALVETLASVVPVKRVFSVFAVEPITRAFAGAWTHETGVSVAYTDLKANLSCEYYAALLTYCDHRTFRPRQMTLHPVYNFDIRPAVESDIPAVAALCHGFAAESEPFTMTLLHATQEARMLVENGLVWVHAISLPGRPADIASICAVTRSSDTVSAITKVYTNPAFRKMGCAERLVRRVCSHYLRTLRKDRVILYVAHSNPAAQTVYRRVGFVGLDGNSGANVEPWLEIGFDRNVVELGHW